jgi:Chs5-Arf1p-binding protein BUD7/BCH1
MQKLQETTPALRGDEKVANQPQGDSPENGNDDGASTKALHSVELSVAEDEQPQSSTSDDPRQAAESPSQHAIPTIKISTESEREREQLHDGTANGMADSTRTTMDGPAPGLEKPNAAAHDGAKDGLGITTEMAATDGEASPSNEEEQRTSGPSFTNKRLCERWLDNLFMVLYEVCQRFSLFLSRLIYISCEMLAAK